MTPARREAKHRKIPTPRREWLAVIRRAVEGGAFDDLVPPNLADGLDQGACRARAFGIAGEPPDVPEKGSPVSFALAWKFLAKPSILVEGC